jgi:periplasmic protein CpxP/Spy
MTIKSSSYAVALLAGLVMPAVSLPVGAFAQTPSAAPSTGSSTGSSTGPSTAPSTAPSTGRSTAAKPMASASKLSSPAERVEQHITQMHAELRITPAQQAQWDQFAQVMRDNAKGMDQIVEQRGAHLATMTAPENMSSYTQIAQQHAQDMQKLTAAFQTLYSGLSDEQKKNADEVFRARGEQHAAMKH